MVQPNPAHGWKNSAHQLAKKKKLRTVLAVAGPLIVLATFVCKEVAVGELKDWSDSIQTARSAVGTQRNQSSISTQIMTISEEMQLYKVKDVVASQDYSAVILQDSTVARQAVANLDADFESTSQLIDKLLFIDVYGNWRKQRDEQRKQVDEANRFVQETLAPSPKNDLGRMMIVKLAMIKPLIAELPLVFLESSAMTATKKVQDALDWIRRALTRLSYLFYVIGLALGLYATLLGGKTTQE
jgi:hypothetical protein